MSRWTRGEATVERLLTDGELQTLTGAHADGMPWVEKARRTVTTALAAADSDPDSAYILAYDAARFAATAVLVQQGLRPTTRGGHYALDVAVRDQVGGPFTAFGGMRRQRNELEYPLFISGELTPADARSAAAQAKEMIDAAHQLLPHLGLFSS